MPFGHKSFEINHSVDLGFALLFPAYVEVMGCLKVLLFGFDRCEEAVVSFFSLGHIKDDFVKNSNEYGKYFILVCNVLQFTYFNEKLNLNKLKL